MKESKNRIFSIPSLKRPGKAFFNILLVDPQTENWQKAIGAHNLWISADVDVKNSNQQPSFIMRMTLHVEDRYNFNPGEHDRRVTDEPFFRDRQPTDNRRACNRA